MNAELSAIRALFEGAYELQEWHFLDGIARVPEVAGRFLLINGAITTMLHDRRREYEQVSLAMWGAYRLTPTEFAYRYDDSTRVSLVESSVSISNDPLWQGMRVFRLEIAGESLRMRAATGQEFLFDQNGLRYSERDSILRVWRRIEFNV